jgi:hypothetical protein
MKKKYIIGGIVLGAFFLVSLAKADPLFVKFVGSDTVYKAYQTAAEFFSDGGNQDFSNVQTIGEQNLGSVNVANEYHSTSTLADAAGHYLVQTGGTILGSVIIASSSGSTFKVWNATSTNDLASTTYVTFKASTAEGVFTFDSILTRGLVIQLPAGFNGNFVVTYR